MACFREALNKLLRERIATFRGARNLAYLNDMSWLLSALGLALRLAPSFIQHLLRVLAQFVLQSLIKYSKDYGGVMKTWVIILSLVLVALFIGSADRAIDNIRESRIAETSREMMVTGDWLMPHFNGDLRLQKPPLTYWTTAISYKLFGVSELSTRFPSMLFGLMLLALVFVWVKQEIDFKTAVHVALVLGTSVIAMRHFRSGEADTVLIFFISAACYAGFNLLHRTVSERDKWAVWCMLAMGLGFLAKGPAGIAIPLFTLLVYAYLSKQLPALKKLLSPLGLGLFVLTAAGWYIWIFLTMPDAANYFFGKQIDETFVSGTHPQPIYWYLLHITEFFLPWGLLLVPMAIWYYRRQPTFSMISFALVWLAVVFVLLTATVNKQMQYALLFAPPVAILLGHYMQTATGRFYQFNKVVFWLLCFAAMAIVIYAAKKHGMHALADALWAPVLLLPIILKRVLDVEYPATPVLVAAILAVFAYLFSEQYLTKSVEKNDIQQLTLQSLSYEPIFQSRPGNGAFSFYAKKPIRTMKLQDISHFMQMHDVVWYLSEEKPELKQYSVQEEKTVGKWTLWKISK